MLHGRGDAKVRVSVIVTEKDHVPERLKNRHYVIDPSGFRLVAFCYSWSEADTLKEALIGDGYMVTFPAPESEPG